MFVLDKFYNLTMKGGEIMKSNIINAIKSGQKIRIKSVDEKWMTFDGKLSTQPSDENIVGLTISTYPQNSYFVNLANVIIVETIGS